MKYKTKMPAKMQSSFEYAVWISKKKKSC